VLSTYRGSGPPLRWPTEAKHTPFSSSLQRPKLARYENLLWLSRTCTLIHEFCTTPHPFVVEGQISTEQTLEHLIRSLKRSRHQPIHKVNHTIDDAIVMCDWLFNTLPRQILVMHGTIFFSRSASKHSQQGYGSSL
jgi:hypothetical protein